MKKTLFYVLLIVFSLSASTVFANISSTKFASDNGKVPDKKENKLTDEQLSRIKNRVEEIRKMDKSKLTVQEKRALKKELRVMKANERRDGVIYIGGGTLLLIIILLIILL